MHGGDDAKKKKSGSLLCIHDWSGDKKQRASWPTAVQRLDSQQEEGIVYPRCARGRTLVRKGNPRT